MLTVVKAIFAQRTIMDNLKNKVTKVGDCNVRINGKYFTLQISLIPVYRCKW